MFFPCINRKQFPSVRNHEPLPTSAVLAKKELVLESFLVSYDLGLCYHNITVVGQTQPVRKLLGSAKAGVFHSWPEADTGPRTEQACACRFLTLKNGPHRSGSHERGESWQITTCKVVKNMLQRYTQFLLTVEWLPNSSLGKARHFHLPLTTAFCHNMEHSQSPFLPNQTYRFPISLLKEWHYPFQGGHSEGRGWQFNFSELIQTLSWVKIKF